ncbi:hypothetical protein GCM10007881_34140 [Mesorhizobium huakuii]|nr:hypothetical protein GCM10007881_34140 [Mesorhizobium huakuii]
MAKEAFRGAGGASDHTLEMRADLVAVAGRLVAGHAAVEDVLALHRVAAGMGANGGGNEKKAGGGNGSKHG